MFQLLKKSWPVTVAAAFMLTAPDSAFAQRGGGGRPGGGGGRPGGGMPSGGGRPIGGMPSMGPRSVGGFNGGGRPAPVSMPTRGGMPVSGGMPAGGGTRPQTGWQSGGGNWQNGNWNKGNWHNGHNHPNSNVFVLGLGYGGWGWGWGGWGGYGGSPYYYGTNALSYYYDSTPVVVSGPASQYDTSTGAANIPPPPEPNAVDPSEARITVVLPAADAQVWFNDSPTTTTGQQREYRTTGLEPSRTYKYTIRAQWNEGGKAVMQTRIVPVQAGQMSVANFGLPETITVPPTNPEK